MTVEALIIESKTKPKPDNTWKFILLFQESKIFIKNLQDAILNRKPIPTPTFNFLRKNNWVIIPVTTTAIVDIRR